MNNTNCSHPKVQYSLQRKVCGFWGCHWRDETKLNPIALPVNGSVQREVSTTCHGTHHYRMFARLTWVEMTFEDQGGRWSPMLVTNTKTFNSPSTQITCLDTQH